MLYTPSVYQALAVTVIYNSLVYDYLMRARVVGLGIDYHVLEQTPVPPLQKILDLPVVSSLMTAALCLTGRHLSPSALEVRGLRNTSAAAGLGALTVAERTRTRAILDAHVAALFGLSYSDLRRILNLCDLPRMNIVGKQLDPKGFWRIDRQRDPELRHTVLTLIAFRDLDSRIHDATGDRSDGVREFFAQNDGEGWLLPETLRLADYGLGHDDRAHHPQSVAARLGPRFYDWQLAQGADEAFRECHLHARNLLGHVEYGDLIERLIEDGVVSEDRHHEYFDDPARDVMHDEAESQSRVADGMTTGDGTARRAAEPKPDYPAKPSAKWPQREMFQGLQAELFE